MTMEGNNMDEQQSLFAEDQVEEQDEKQEVDHSEEVVEGEGTSESEMVHLEDGRSFTMDEWNAPVFFDGPTREMVELWKTQFGKIYMVPFDFNTFIIRGLTRPEYRSIQEERAKLTESNEQEPLEARLSRKFDNEELIAAICTVWPLEAQTEEYYISKVPAGTAGILAEMIYDKSAFRALTPPIAL